jgi:hypothetical protein
VIILRYNNLKIFIASSEAKPGGNIGAMLSPYLLSVNLNDFCKKFNELTSDYEEEFWHCIHIYCDAVERLYSFKIKPFFLSFFFLYSFYESYRLNIIFLFDLTLFYIKVYNCSLYAGALTIFSLIKNFRRNCKIIRFGKSLNKKLINYVSFKTEV